MHRQNPSGKEARKAAQAAEEYRRRRAARETELVRLKVLPPAPTPQLPPARQPHRHRKITQPLPTKEMARAARVAKATEKQSGQHRKKRRQQHHGRWKYGRPRPLDYRPAYAEYMASATWKQVRLWKLERAGWKCERCGRKGKLDVHHLTYDRLGRELLTDLQALCRLCHQSCHDADLMARSHLGAILRG
jgi:5-methylcytosine-specific restriction endonuclease McrA